MIEFCDIVKKKITQHVHAFIAEKFNKINFFRAIIHIFYQILLKLFEF